MYNERISLQNFACKIKSSLSKDKTLFTEFSFKKGDDLISVMEISLLKEKISSIYSNRFHDLIISLNKNLNYEDEYAFSIKKIISDKKNLRAIQKFWAKNENNEKRSSLNENMENKLDANFIKINHFVQICTLDLFNLKLVNFFQEIIKSNAFLLESYKNDEQKLGITHNEDLKAACAKGAKENEIEELTNLHFQRLTELEIIYNLQHEKKTKKQRNELQTMIDSNLPMIKEMVKKNQENKNFKDPSNELMKMKKENENLKNNKFVLKLCLGAQRKYFFNIKVKEAQIKELILIKETDIEKIFERSKNEIHNFYFGVDQIAILNLVHIKSETMEKNNLNELLKLRTDVFFEGYEKQIIEIYEKNKIIISNGSVFITKHSCSYQRLAFSILYEDFFDFQSDNECLWFQKIIEVCNDHLVKELIIPLDFFFKSGTIKIQIKSFGEILNKFLKVINREIKDFSYHYAANHWLKKITIIIPKETENQNNLFERSKEIIRNAFE